MNNSPEINLTLDPFGQAEAAQIAEAAEGVTEQQAESVEQLAEANRYHQHRHRTPVRRCYPAEDRQFLRFRLAECSHQGFRRSGRHGG